MKITVHVREGDDEALRELARSLGYTDPLRGAGKPEEEWPGSISALMRAIAQRNRERPVLVYSCLETALVDTDTL